MRDRVRRACFDAVAAENAARIVYVVDLRIAFTGGNPFSVGIFRGFDIDTVRRASSGTKKAADTFFETVFIALQDVNTAIAWLDRRRSVGKTLSRSFLEHRPQGDAEALNERDECFSSFLNDVRHLKNTLTKLEDAGNGAMRHKTLQIR